MSWICHRLERSREWFYKWWNRYQLEGASGLRDRSHAPKTNPHHWSSELCQAVLHIRDQLMRHHGPRERYRLARAATIRHELACLATTGTARDPADRQSELFGQTSHLGSLNRLIRLALLVGVNLTFIPEHESWRNSSIEHFNGWLQERVLAIPLHSPAQVRRELNAMIDTCFQEHIHPHLNFQTAAQVRKNLSPRTLPHNFHQHLEPLPVAIGRVTFIRRVRP